MTLQVEQWFVDRRGFVEHDSCSNRMSHLGDVPQLLVAPTVLAVTVAALPLALSCFARPRLLVRTRLHRWGLAYSASNVWSLFLCITFVNLVLYNEVGVHYFHACSSPHPTRLLVIADPQLVDEYAYPTLPPWAHTYTAWLCDVQVRRSWRAAVWRLAPSAAVIAGDLMWGSFLYTNVAQWRAGLRRLNAVFGGPAWRDDKFLPSLRTHVVLGNHDSGMYVCADHEGVDLLKLWRDAVCIGDFFEFLPPHVTSELPTMGCF